jgi:uncharacterized membrane protein YjgN (DUF898 family)
MQRRRARGHQSASMDPDSLPLAQPAAGPRIESFSVTFAGSGRDFARIWRANVLLGWYSQRVHRRAVRYFIENTRVAGHPLEYLDTPTRSALGFPVVVVLLLALFIAVDTGQMLAMTALLFLGLALLPYRWGLTWRNRVQSVRWRTMRPRFVANWTEIYGASSPLVVVGLAWSACLVLVRHLLAPEAGIARSFTPDRPWLLPMGILGLALIIGMAAAARLDFNYQMLAARRLRVGSHWGQWKAQAREVDAIWFGTLAWLLGGLLIAALLVAAIIAAGQGLFGALEPPRSVRTFFVLGITLLGVLLVALASAPARAWREARMFRLIWNTVGLGGVARFKCRLSAHRYMRLRLWNQWITLCTLGIYRPYARVREYRMRVESVTVFVKGRLDQRVNESAFEEKSTGLTAAGALGPRALG